MQKLVVVVVAVIVCASARAEPGIPDALKPWIPWTLRGVERERCPARTDGVKVCEAPGRLELTVEKRGGSFTQRWHVDTAVGPDGARVTLPGDGRRWPLDVEVDGHAAIVGEGALVTLPAGDHTVRGRFQWDAPPESIPIPAATAVVRLVVDGREVAFVDRGDAGDRVWLKRDSGAEEREEDRLDVAVFRKITDGVPLLLETQVLLEVSGKGREVSLPGAVLDGFAPLSLTGDLPAHVDGTALKVQVRAGRHALTLVERRDTDDRDLVTAKIPMGGEGSEEVWVFAADHAVRVANVTGVPSIVAEQTRLPAAWRALPAYRVLPGDKVTLDQRRRGDESPPPSQLTLNRTLWLDFDGHGYTVHDDLTGRFSGDRLLMGAGTTLGRVSTGDGPGDAFITRIGGKDVGVEVRSPNVRVSADSRIDGHAERLPAVSWAHDFQSVRATLHMPPGYRLLHASGVDEVETTWVKSWTLFELFLVVVIVLAMGRLWGVLVGALCAAAMVLTFQEDGAVRGLWVVVVVLAALHRVLPPAWETRAVSVVLKWLRFGTAVVVALVALVFCIHQVRVGMYPVLEQEDRRVGDGDLWGRGQYGNDNTRGFEGEATTVLAPKGAADAPVAQLQQLEPNAVDERNNNVGRSLSFASDGYATKVAMKKQKLSQIDPGSVVQTGPGLPQWGFTSVALRFTGPVKQDQSIDLVLIGPRVNFGLALARVLLIAFLVVVAFGFPGRSWPTAVARAFRGKGALFTVALVLAAVTGSARARADEPPNPPAPPAPPAAPSVLDELRARLLAPPACTPACASIARVALEATDGDLRLHADVHASAAVLVPLPGADKQWAASTILVDGRPSSAALRDAGALWLALSPGRHDVLLEGPLPRRDSVQLAFPLVPHHASFSSTSWTLDGVHEDGVPDANLQLSRTARDRAHASDEAAVLPAFLSVERSLLLGLSFEVETRVVRLSPAGVAIVLEVPLLPGENVTTEGVRAEGKRALLSLGPNDTEVSWSSVLVPTEKLELEAQKGEPFVELWNVEASPVWHVEERGIPPLHDAALASDGPRDGGARAWRPWPGEKLTLTVTRPEGVPGQTVTLEHTSQEVRPGIRSTDVTLTLDMRASRGGEHVVTLPAGAELLSASVNGAPQPLRPNGDKLTVPVVPGKQQIALATRVPTGVSFLFETPKFDVGDKSVNAEVLVDVPADRWVLFAAGPRAGPAVLFWSFIVVLMLAGVGLARVPFSPLRLYQWVLLGLGLTQVPIGVAALVAGWLLALGWRKRAIVVRPGLFNLVQILLAMWTALALVGLAVAIHEGLLGAPDMQIAGNGSHAAQLRWFADHATSSLPVTLTVSAPMLAYRAAMLAWALWLAASLLGWLRYGWGAFAEGGLWRAIPRAAPRGPRPTSSTEAPPGAPTSAAVPGPVEPKK